MSSIVDILRLDPQIRKSLYGVVDPYKGTDIRKVIIDGNEIDGYFEYSYFDAKTYSKSPKRSLSGAITNLNSISTFLTPQLRIKFNLMSIDTYRTIMKLIQSKNEFTVTCYNVVWDKQVTHNMYFEPENYPELYIYDLELLGVLNYSIVLVGTNTEITNTSITYNFNPPGESGLSNFTVGSEDFAKNLEVIVGGLDAQSITEYQFSGTQYKFKHWTENADGTGFVYLDGAPYMITQSGGISLYAQWEYSNTYVLSYNYGIGTIKTDDNGNQINSKSIVANSAIGELPTTNYNAVTWSYDNDETKKYYPYTFKGWYWNTQGEGNSVNANTIYNVIGNATLYQVYIPNNYTITYYVDGKVAYTMTLPYGASFIQPTPTKSGYTFNGWYLESGLTTKYNGTTTPPKNINLYAKFTINS